MACGGALSGRERGEKTACGGTFSRREKVSKNGVLGPAGAGWDRLRQATACLVQIIQEVFRYHSGGE